MPPPSTHRDSTGVVRWAGHARDGDDTTDVLVVVRYDPHPDPFAEDLRLGGNRFRLSNPIPVPFGTLGEPKEARRRRAQTERPRNGIPDCIDWVLRIGRMEYDGWCSHHQGQRVTLMHSVPIFDVIDRHSGAVWRLGLGLDHIETGHGFTHHWDATPQPCTFRPGDLPEDRYDAALALTGWDQYR